MSDRSANWDVVRRCLKLLVMLQRRPHSTDELLNKLYGLGVKREAAVKRLEKDLQRLKNHWGVDITYDRSEKAYHLMQMGQLALIDLPTEALHALIFLERTFFEGVPYDNEVNALVASIKRALPEERLREWQTLAAQRGITLSMEDFDREIRHDVLEQLRRAHHERRIVTFEYLSPQQADQQARHHRVEPREIKFHQGHLYLVGFCLYGESHKGTWDRQYFDYRIAYIVPDSLTILAQHFPVDAPRRPRYTVTYRLTPTLARGQISQRFNDMQIEYQSDGAAIVTGWTHDLFAARRILLAYGENCQVLGGPELLQDVRRTIIKMAQYYAGSPTDMRE